MHPTSAHRAPQRNRPDTPGPDVRRGALARALRAGTVLFAGLVLAVAAWVDGHAAAAVLAVWVAVLAGVGLRISKPSARPASALVPAPLRPGAARRPVLILAELNGVGELGTARTFPVVASDAAIAVIDSRPRG